MTVSLRCDCAFFLEKLAIIKCCLWLPESVARQTGKLDKHLVDIDEQARERFERIIEQMKQVEQVTEELKAKDLLAWVQAMNSICNRADEIVRQQLIYN